MKENKLTKEEREVALQLKKIELKRSQLKLEEEEKLKLEEKRLAEEKDVKLDAYTRYVGGFFAILFGFALISLLFQWIGDFFNNFTFYNSK